MIASPSVKTKATGGSPAVDAPQLVNGRQRHSRVDRLGVLLRGVVTAVRVHDWDGAPLLLEGRRHRVARLRLSEADPA